MHLNHQSFVDKELQSLLSHFEDIEWERDDVRYEYRIQLTNPDWQVQYRLADVEIAEHGLKKLKDFISGSLV